MFWNKNLFRSRFYTSIKLRQRCLIVILQFCAGWKCKANCLAHVSNTIDWEWLHAQRSKGFPFPNLQLCEDESQHKPGRNCWGEEPHTESGTKEAESSSNSEDRPKDYDDDVNDELQIDDLRVYLHRAKCLKCCLAD